MTTTFVGERVEQVRAIATELRSLRGPLLPVLHAVNARWDVSTPRTCR